MPKAAESRLSCCSHHRCATCAEEQTATLVNVPHRTGFALLMTLFVIGMVTIWLTDMLTSQTIHMSAVRNTVEYEQALYLASAGVHHAATELDSDPSWRGTVSSGGYPASGSYEATAADGVLPGTVDIASSGVSGSIVRNLYATAQVN